MGTLTVGINALVRKGYVEKNRGEKDKRIVYASLTDKGRRAYEHHMTFHKDMVDAITDGMTEEEALVMHKTFTKLNTFFKNYKDY